MQTDGAVHGWGAYGPISGAASLLLLDAQVVSENMNTFIILPNSRAFILNEQQALLTEAVKVLNGKQMAKRRNMQSDN